MIIKSPNGDFETRLTPDDMKVLLDYVTYNHEYVSKPFQRFFRLQYGWGPQQLAIICYLARNERLSMSQAADMIGVSRQQMTQLIASLVDKDLARREYDKSNRRIIYITSTEYGMETLRTGEAEFLRNVITSLKDFDSERLRYLLQAAKDLTHFITEEMPPL